MKNSGTAKSILGLWNKWGKRGVVNMGKGEYPGLGSYGTPGGDPRLPGRFIDKEHDKLVIMEEPTILSVSEEGYIIPCNGGKDYEITYDSLDEEYGVKNSDLTRTVTKGEKYVLPANKYAGRWRLFDLLQNPECGNGFDKTGVDQERAAAATLGLIQMPIAYKTTGSVYDLVPGDIVTGDGIVNLEESPTARLGAPVRWEETNGVENQAGRILYVEDIDNYYTSGLEKVQADGFDVQSKETAGLPRVLKNAVDKIKDNPDYKIKVVWINIFR